MSASLTEKVSKMDDAKFERWMKRNGYTGMAAVRLSQKRRESIANTKKIEQERELAAMPENVLHNAAKLLDAAYPDDGKPVVIDNTIPKRVSKQLRQMIGKRMAIYDALTGGGD